MVAAARRQRTFEEFRTLATTPGLALHERIDDTYATRAGKEPLILDDLRAKMPHLDTAGGTIIDIGPGCGPLPRLLIERAGVRDQTYVAIDSAEMLAHLPDAPSVEKRPGRFPDNVDGLGDLTGTASAVLVYSVLHYVFEHGNVFHFLDTALTLLMPGGELLIGDVPNRSQQERRRAASEERLPDGRTAAAGGLDDSAIAALLQRAHAQGIDAWLLPQRAPLPMADGRVDLLFRRPTGPGA